MIGRLTDLDGIHFKLRFDAFHKLRPGVGRGYRDTSQFPAVLNAQRETHRGGGKASSSELVMVCFPTRVRHSPLEIEIVKALSYSASSCLPAQKPFKRTADQRELPSFVLVEIVALYVEPSQSLLEDQCILLEEDADRLVVAALAAKIRAEAARKKCLDFKFNAAHHEALSENPSSSHSPTEILSIFERSHSYRPAPLDLCDMLHQAADRFLDNRQPKIHDRFLENPCDINNQVLSKLLAPFLASL